MTNTVIQKLVELGLDLNTKHALKHALQTLGIKPENLDRLYLELKNSINNKSFRKTNPKKRICFLPQCLRNTNCPAKLNDNGYDCQQCGQCKIATIKKTLQPLGYKIFIVPGGSLVEKIIQNCAH